MSLAACIPLLLALFPLGATPLTCGFGSLPAVGYMAPDKLLHVFSARAGICSGIILAHRADLRQRYGTNVTGEPSLLRALREMGDRQQAGFMTKPSALTRLVHVLDQQSSREE